MDEKRRQKVPMVSNVAVEMEKSITSRRDMNFIMFFSFFSLTPFVLFATIFLHFARQIVMATISIACQPLLLCASQQAKQIFVFVRRGKPHAIDAFTTSK